MNQIFTTLTFNHETPILITVDDGLYGWKRAEKLNFKNMSPIFLKDGTQADLITKTDAGYLVDPYVTHYGYENEEEIAPSGNLKVVQEIYEKAPIHLVDAEFKAALAKVEEQESLLNIKRKEASDLRSEVDRLTRQRTDINKLIINRADFRTAKRLIAFVKDKVAPSIMDSNNDLKLTLSFEITQYGAEERCWIYHMYYGSWSSSDYFDVDSGIKFDLSDDEILALTIERLQKKGKSFSDHVLANTNDKWLTPEYIEKKRAYLEKERINSLRRAEKRLEEAQKEIDKLTQKETLTTQ